MSNSMLNKYATNDLTVLNLADMTYTKNFFESHELRTILERPLPFIIRNDSSCIPDAFAYLKFLTKRSNKNNLSISCEWFNQRSELSRRVRAKITAWLQTHENYALSNNRSITTLNTTSETWQEMCASYGLSSERMGAPSLVAAAEIFQRVVYVVLFNFSQKNVIFFKPQSMTNNNHRNPFIIGMANNRIFVPLLKKRYNIRLLGPLVTSHCQLFHEHPSRVKEKFILTSAEETTEVCSTTDANNQPLDYNTTILNVKLTWIHSTMPHLVPDALNSGILLDWDVTFDYSERVTKEAAKCMQLLHSYVYDKLLKKAESILEETNDHLETVSARINEEEDAQGAQDHYDEYLKDDSDTDENESNDESNSDDQSNESDGHCRPKYSDFVDTLDDDKESVIETKQQIEHIIDELSDVISNANLLSSSALSTVRCTVNYTAEKASEHSERISTYPDADDFDEDMFTGESFSYKQYVSNMFTDESPIRDEIALEDEDVQVIIRRNIHRINQKLKEHIEYMEDNRENLWEKRHRKRVSEINDYVLCYKNTKRCPSVYFIYSGFELMYIGLTKSVTSRFVSGHAAFTKLLNPCYRYQPFRICFFGIDINGSTIENWQTPVSSTESQAATTSSSAKRPKTKEAVLLDCIEQLLINYFKPRFNTQGIEKFHGIKNYMNLNKKIRIQIPIIFLSPYPELTEEGNQNIITIKAK